MNMRRTRTVGGILGLTGILLAGTPSAVQAAAPAPASVSVPAAGPVSTLSDYKLSWGCKNEYPKRASFSFSRGVTSTKIYYNNQCRTTAYVTVYLSGYQSRADCVSVPARTRSHKTIHHGLFSRVDRLRHGC